MTLYRIECRTGCTCCSSENHYRGFYSTREAALARIHRWQQGIENPVASQYSRYGNYGIESCEAEQLPDGRIIVDDRVFTAYSVLEINLETGDILKGEEAIISLGY